MSKAYYNEHYKNLLNRKQQVLFVKEKETESFQKAFNHIPVRIESILEIGCGIGQNLSILKTMFPWVSLFGTDNSLTAVNQAKKHALVIQSDIEKEIIIRKAQIILIYDLLHHINCVKLALHNIQGINHSYLIIKEPNVNNSLVKLISKAFKIEKGLQTLNLENVKENVLELDYELITEYYDEYYPKMEVYLLSKIWFFRWFYNTSIGLSILRRMRREPHYKIQIYKKVKK